MKYIAYLPDGDFDFFDTMEEAQAAIEEAILDECEDGYHLDTEQCGVYELVRSVKLEVVDKKENYVDKPWPYIQEHDEIWKHSFVNESNDDLSKLEILQFAKNFVDAVETEEIIIQENFDNDGHENCGNRLYNQAKKLIEKIKK